VEFSLIATVARYRVVGPLPNWTRNQPCGCWRRSHLQAEEIRNQPLCVGSSGRDPFYASEDARQARRSLFGIHVRPLSGVDSYCKTRKAPTPWFEFIFYFFWRLQVQTRMRQESKNRVSVTDCLRVATFGLDRPSLFLDCAVVRAGDLTWAPMLVGQSLKSDPSQAH